MDRLVVLRGPSSYKKILSENEEIEEGVIITPLPKKVLIRGEVAFSREKITGSRLVCVLRGESNSTDPALRNFIAIVLYKDMIGRDGNIPINLSLGLKRYYRQYATFKTWSVTLGFTSVTDDALFTGDFYVKTTSIEYAISRINKYANVEANPTVRRKVRKGPQRGEWIDKPRRPLRLEWTRIYEVSDNDGEASSEDILLSTPTLRVYKSQWLTAESIPRKSWLKKIILSVALFTPAPPGTYSLTLRLVRNSYNEWVETFVLGNDDFLYVEREILLRYAGRRKKDREDLELGGFNVLTGQSRRPRQEAYPLDPQAQDLTILNSLQLEVTPSSPLLYAVSCLFFFRYREDRDEMSIGPTLSSTDPMTIYDLPLT